ncbi:Ras GTPase-activating-like protein rng2 [Sphaceloma murrayae]|uniref:Ras GTPase-activating-like protein rng2 n=1 Tax=Sphaceloma murrayae TaxID=2082308 RepID=A0A2K1R0N0_9PEZI|nr:Ras GTPase-activating-like protein rng2 [Sphaceloma murrayae]
MAYAFPPQPRSPLGSHNLPQRSSPSPLRHSQSALFQLDSPQAHSADENSHSRDGSVSRQYSKVGARRELFEMNSSPTLNRDYQARTQDTYRAPEPLRSALRPLSQAPNGSPKHGRSHSQDVRFADDEPSSPPSKTRPHSLAISRSDSIRAPLRDRNDRPVPNHIHFASQPDLTNPTHLQGLQRSTTGHLRTLSKYAEDNGEEDFAIKSREQEVVGLHGRRRLQRTMSTKPKMGSPMSKYASGWQSSKWMDQQRQFLQAYEYLCHIGEAKEWIEDIMQKQIPPIVELEEALRDGVTLAEIVQSIFPERPMRIFRHQKLQFRHSDNIAMFFRFLAEMELPELFRFELVDLYEKKNIPKVIYCIHALSWLLFRKGIVDFRIGNLVGQLQFEDHELEATQKGLDKAGVSMPNFSGMSANFDIEPEEPQETDEERVDRELAEQEMVIEDLQSQIRGALVRLQLGDNMQALWDFEPQLSRLQAVIRGDFARQIAQYRLDMRSFAVKLQASSRGFLVRSRRQERDRYWKDRERLVVGLQSRFRAQKVRAQTKHMQSTIRRHESGVKDFQAAIRGALARWSVGDQYHEARENEQGVQELQATIRGALTRKAIESQLMTMRECDRDISRIQAFARAHLARRGINDQIARLQQHQQLFVHLQKKARGAAARRSVAATKQDIKAQTNSIALLQAALRGSGVRNFHDQQQEELQHEESKVASLQTALRGFLTRRRLEHDRRALQSCSPSIQDLQSFTRGYLNRQHTYDVLCELNNNEESIVALQSAIRTNLLQRSIGHTLEELTEEEDSIAEMQTVLRGFLVRQQFAEKKKFYKQNMEKVIKIQSFVRAKQQGQAYKSLTTGKNPPVGTVKNFVHLLNDSGFDFDEELEFERMRKTVSQHVRQNELAEQYIDQLDIKIALLVKNKITLDEVIRHQRQFGGHVGSLLNNKELSSKDPFDLRALNKNSRRKLEHYQEMFFLLQTQPQYLAKLFKKFREQGLPEKESKRTELLIMGMFGFAQKRREEYYLMRLVAASMKEEADACNSLQDYLRGNFFWSKILSAYLRSPRDRKFMKDLFGPMVRDNIFESEGLDLESDPLQIYRSAINNEELRTGQRSMRSPDVGREEAIRDPETRDMFIAHLQDLRDIADHCFALLEETLARMPFGVRYITQQQYEVLHQRFPHEDQHHLLQICGHWLWKNYLLPALTQPEMWGVIDRGLNPQQKRNVSEVGKVVGQVFTGRLFGGENIYLQPLNTWVSESIERLGHTLVELINVRDAEAHFDIDEFNDLYSTTKPTLYIKMADIFSIHHLVTDHIQLLCPSQDDPLREIVTELGSVKSNENEMMGVSSQEISLQLQTKYHDMQDPDADVKALFMETKRLALYIIRVQSGANMLDILVKPISQEDDDKWLALLDEEYSQQNALKSRRKSAYAPSIVSANPASSSLDVTTLTYAELKSSCLENILTLERHGRLSRHNQYQDLLNAIAIDIRTKHRRRVQRARELEGVRATLAQLDAKAAFLDEQLQSYNDYVEQAMVTLQNKKGKKRFLMPFSKQYNHEKELARSGRTPKFGSFKYSARQLAEKGVLVAWTGYTEEKWGRINITISSDEVGVFHIEGSTGSMMIPGASASVPLDDLLQAQFENSQFIHLFPDGGLKFNVNLFLNLVYKKFFD